MNMKTYVRSLVLTTALALVAGVLAPAVLAEGDAAKKTLNVNQASADEFSRLPRVGAKLAARIVLHRSQHGPFKRIEDLMAVKGVGEKMFTSLKPYLTVSGTTTLTEKVASKPARSSGGKAKAAPKAASKAAAKTPKKSADAPAR